MVGIEVDAGDVALLLARHGRRALVPLEDEVGAVVVAAVRTRRAAEDEVRVLVGLRLLRLRPRGGVRRHHLRHRRVLGRRRVVLVAEVRHDPARVLERRRALRDHELVEPAAENRRGRVAGGLLIRIRNRSELRAVRSGCNAARHDADRPCDAGGERPQDLLAHDSPFSVTATCRERSSWPLHVAWGSRW